MPSNPLQAPRIWWPVAVGLLAMYLPLYYMLATTLWENDTQVHGPIVLAVTLYLLWESRNSLLYPADPKPMPRLGWSLLIFGLILYVLGQSQSILMVAVGSQIPVLLGILLISQGLPAIRTAWFPILFLAFMVPLPGFLVDAATNPLKQHVSILAEQLLYALHYPVARSGVVITIGPYQLLVADACSGLHSIFSLSAMGFLYLYLMRHDSVLRNVILMAAILPIAFLSNVVRVVVLALITYYLGDEAGQGFLHGFAGILLFIVAVLSLFLIDWILGWFLHDTPLNAKHATAQPTSVISVRPTPLLWSGVAMVLAMGLGYALVPRTMLAHEEKPFDLATMIPKQFGSWHALDTAPQIVNPELESEIDKIYSQTLSRSYINAQGQVIMLSIAYGGNQSDNMQVHRPEVCYPAQGFPVLQQPKVEKLILPYGNIHVRRLVAGAGERIEPITYWLTIGDAVAGTGLRWKLDQLKYGLTGVIPDGLIFRVSTINPDYSKAYVLENTFIRDLLSHVSAASRERLIGRSTNSREQG